MERYEIGGDEKLTSLIEAAARGEEAVITRDGREVAQVVAPPVRKGSLNPEKLAAAQQAFAHLHNPAETGAELIRRMRDESGH